MLENKIKDINRMKREHSVRIACAAGTMAFLCGVTAFAAGPSPKADKAWGKKLVCRGRRVKCAAGGDGDCIGGDCVVCP